MSATREAHCHFQGHLGEQDEGNPCYPAAYIQVRGNRLFFFLILKNKQLVCLLDSGLLCLLPFCILRNCTVPKKWEARQMSILFSSFIFDVSLLWEDDQGLFTGPFGGQGPLLLRSEQL